MYQTTEGPLAFQKRSISAEIIEPDGTPAEKPVEIRIDPVSGRSCRITFARAKETTEKAAFPPPPPGGG